MNYKKIDSWKAIVTVAEIVVTVVTIGFGVLQAKGLFSLTGPASNSQQATITTQVPADEMINIGAYRCSKVLFQALESLQPSELEKTNLEIEKKELDEREAALKILFQTIETKQSDRVENYNAAVTAYEADLKKLNLKIDDFNKKLAVYEEFLKENCKLK